MLSPEEKQDWLRAYSPSNLRYVAAIRGYVPADQSAGYTYALLNCGEGSTLIALAASNPEGVFFGFDADADKLETASNAAMNCGVENVKFVQADAAALTEAVQSGALQPAFNFVVSNLSNDAPESDIAPTVTLAGSLLSAGGLCYIAYPVSTASSEMQAGATNTDVAHAAGSAAQLGYVGSAKIKNNYMEFTVHPDHQSKLVEAHGKPVFESLKDIAVAARVRHDMWVKPGAEQSTSSAALLQSFHFGMATPAAYIEPQYKYFGKKLDLTTPLFTRLLSVLSETSHGIGDLIAHPDFAGASQDEIIGGLQMLVAIGLVEPTRGDYRFAGSNFDMPHFMTTYNQRLREAAVGEEGALLAAPMLGRPVLGTAPMILTLQAIDQGGLKGAEEILDQTLQSADAAVKSMIGTDLTDSDTRRNTAYSLLENVVKDWLLFCCVNGIMQPA